MALAALASGADIRFREHLIAGDLKGGYQTVIADMNRDGRPDIIALASGMPELVWYENPRWQRHVIAGPFARMINVGAHDTNGDGVPELVLAHEFANQARNSIGIVSVLEQKGGVWSVKEIDRLTTSHRIRWADIDGSGKKVAVNAPLTGAAAAPPDYRDRAPLVFYRPGEWKRETISDANEGVVHGIHIADWDGDRREDILTASFLGIHAHRLSTAGSWERTEIAKGDPSAWPKSGSSDIATGQVRARRFLAAIEPWHGNQVAVYWGTDRKREVIDDSLVDGHTILAADFDRDGRDEIVAGFRGAGRSVHLYRLDEKSNHWKRQTVDDGGIAAASCAAADLNRDRRPDLVCIGSATANLKWYENVR